MFLINFSDIKMKLDMILYHNELQIKFEFRQYWWMFDRVISPWTKSYLWGQVSAGVILVPFRGRHLVPCWMSPIWRLILHVSIRVDKLTTNIWDDWSRNETIIDIQLLTELWKRVGKHSRDVISNNLSMFILFSRTQITYIHAMPYH